MIETKKINIFFTKFKISNLVVSLKSLKFKLCFSSPDTGKLRLIIVRERLLAFVKIWDVDWKEKRVGE